MFVTIFSLSTFFIVPHVLWADDTDLSSEVQAVRAKYGDYVSHEQGAKILDTVAWNHKDEGWGLLSKPGGNNCPVGTTPVACDILFNKDSGIIYDVLSSGPGICNGISAAGKAGLSWSSDGQKDLSLWVEPIDPASLPDGMGSDVILPDDTPGCGPGVAVDPNAIPKSTNLPIPNQGLPTDIGQLISAIFTWSLSIIGLVIFVRFFYAGFKWAFLSAGNSAHVQEAKEMMKNAVYGALILFSAWLILNTINPDLVGGELKLPGLPAGQPPAGNTP